MARTKKPELNNTENLFTWAIFRTMRANVKNAFDVERKSRNMLTKLCKLLEKLCLEGMAEEAIRQASRCMPADMLFKAVVVKARDANYDEFTNHPEAKRHTEAQNMEAYTEMRLVALKIVKLYEWGTGKNFETGKKVRKGAWDAEAE